MNHGVLPQYIKVQSAISVLWHYCTGAEPGRGDYNKRQRRPSCEQEISTEQ